MYSTFRLTSGADVPIGKIALKDLKEGDTAMKYGEDIGKIIAISPKVDTFTHTTVKPSAGKEKNSWLPKCSNMTVKAYRRENGRVGVRNHG